ncbi:MAG: M24 family metallopeptidase, partial [Clostridia bacterium]
VVRYRAVMEATSAKQSVDASGVLREMRMFKAPEELATMKRAIQMIEDVLRSVLPRVKPGVSELDLVAELEYQMKKHGAAGPAFDTMVLAGKKAGQPHGVPDSRKIEPGELVLFDTGGIVDGYHSDITRTFAVGDVNEQLVDMYETVLQANLAAIAAVRPGQHFADIDKAARDVIQRNGYGDFYLTRVGHGIGLEIHEYPSMHANNVEQAREGMVFTIEPGIYNPLLAGVRIEDNVYVTSTGVEVLTSFPKHLMVIGG